MVGNQNIADSIEIDTVGYKNTFHLYTALQGRLGSILLPSCSLPAPYYIDELSAINAVQIHTAMLLVYSRWQS